MAMASESHVDRSISDPVPFIRNNTDVICNTLELARELEPAMVIVVSTDEVYGPVRGGYACPEWSTICVQPVRRLQGRPGGHRHLLLATYGVPVVLTNTMNIIASARTRRSSCRW